MDKLQQTASQRRRRRLGMPRPTVRPRRDLITNINATRSADEARKEADSTTASKKNC